MKLGFAALGALLAACGTSPKKPAAAPQAAAVPDTPAGHWRHARELARMRRNAEAVAELDWFAEKRLFVPASSTPDFWPLRDDPAFQKVVQKLGATRLVVENGSNEWTLDDDLLVEAVAHDPKTGAFLFSSVRDAAIFRIDSDGGQRDMTVIGDLAPLGMAADLPRRRLWVGAAMVPPAPRWTAADEGRSAVLRISLDNGKIEKRLTVPGKHVFGDLGVAPNGDVWVSDSLGGGVYRVAEGADALELVIAPGTLRSPQGIAFAPDGKAWLSDYRRIYALDTAGRAVHPANAPANFSLFGIDGLTWSEAGLLAVQNGVEPNRLLLLRLDGENIAEVKVLERNDAVVQPTSGCLVGDVFHYVATSQWDNFGDDGALKPPGGRLPVVVRKLVVVP